MPKKVVTSLLVYERTDRPGTWTFNAVPIGGKKPSFKSKDEATIAMVEAVNNFNNGIIVAPVKPTSVQSAADKFFAEQKGRSDSREISKAHKDEIVRGVKFCLSIRIDGFALAKQNICDLMQVKNRGAIGRAIISGIEAEQKSKATAEKRVKAIKMLFNYAVTQGWGQVNPLDKMSLIVEDDLTDDRAPRIQPEIIQDLIKFGFGHNSGEGLLVKAMVLTAIASGIRQGELRALPWCNVNFDECTIKIDRAIKHQCKGVGKTKTKRGNRTVPIPAEVIAVLRQLKVSSKYSAADDFVFANNVGGFQTKKTFPKIMDRICDRAGVPLMLWGDFRHFFASVQISSLGEDFAEVAALMGHANSAFTYRQYGHYVKNAKKQKQVTSATAAAMGI